MAKENSPYLLQHAHNPVDWYPWGEQDDHHVERLAISAFARAGVVLNEPRYTQAATKAAAFIESKLYDAGSRTLKRIYREGPSDVGGFLYDHAFLSGAGQAFLAGHAEFIRDMKSVNGKATAYVSSDYACEQPPDDLDVLRTQLQR